MRGLADWLGLKLALSHTPLSFLQGKERYNFPNPNPFVEDDMDKNEIASVAYRYVTSGGVRTDHALFGAKYLKFGTTGDHMSPFSVAGIAGGSLEMTST